MGRRSFARIMQKKESGFYLAVTFRIAADKISVLTSRYHLNDDVFRVQITRVDEKVLAKVSAAAPAVPA
jgi:ribosomal protein S6